MGKFKYLLGASALLLSSVSYAGIIDSTNSNTEYATGLFADLQGLEWLTLDETVGQSRDAIESGVGGFFNDGWRYATRTETETLLNSLWDGVFDGWSADNGPGAKWFGNNFGELSHTPMELSNAPGELLNYQTSWFFFGDDNDCNSSTGESCLGNVRGADAYKPKLSAYNVVTEQVEDSYDIFATSQGLGWFNDFYGANMGHTDNNLTIASNEGYGATGSLLVRATSVPEPSILALMGAGIIGLGFARRRVIKY